MPIIATLRGRMMRLMVEVDVRGRSAETFDPIFGKVSPSIIGIAYFKFHVGFTGKLDISVKLILKF
jgi:hypothetical protein